MNDPLFSCRAQRAHGDAMSTDLGSFEVTSGTLMVSDPCYDLGVWCQGWLETARNGTWNAAVERSYRNGWGMRCVALMVMHSDQKETPLLWEIATFEVGVDSWQAGFWDLSCFPSGDAKGEYGDEWSWYRQVCEITLNEPCAGVMRGGAVSASGLGDGGYECSFARSESGDIVAARIVFLTDGGVGSDN